MMRRTRYSLYQALMYKARALYRHWFRYLPKYGIFRQLTNIMVCVHPIILAIYSALNVLVEYILKLQLQATIGKSLQTIKINSFK